MRPDWDKYYMDIAEAVSARATCPRKSVGAVFIKTSSVPRILSTGYNGSIPGAPHCLDVGCDIRNGHCERTIHAEENAVISAAREGVSLKGSTLYVTAFPCWKCFKMIASVGTKRIVYKEAYRIDERVLSEAKRANIELVPFNREEKEKCRYKHSFEDVGKGIRVCKRCGATTWGSFPGVVYEEKGFVI